MGDDVETMTPDDLIDALMVWRGTIQDADNNYDARLLKRAAEIIQAQWDRIGNLEDEINKKAPANRGES